MENFHFICFRFISRGHKFQCRCKIWYESAVGKLPKCHVTEIKTRPILPATNISLDLFISTKFGPDWLRFAGLIPKRLLLFF